MVGEHASLLNACLYPCPSNPSITIYECETGEIPNLDAIPEVGCFAVRYSAKIKKVKTVISQLDASVGQLSSYIPILTASAIGSAQNVPESMIPGGTASRTLLPESMTPFCFASRTLALACLCFERRGED